MQKKSCGEHFFITKTLIVYCILYGIPIMKSNIILRNNKESKSLSVILCRYLTGQQSSNSNIPPQLYRFFFNIK